MGWMSRRLTREPISRQKTSRMKSRIFSATAILASSLLLLVVILSSACKSPSTSAAAPFPTPPHRLLFVGDSFTFCNGGMDRHVKLLAASAPRPRDITTDSATQGGATLKILNGKPSVHEKIRSGAYDVVILQDDIPELTEHSPAPFFEHARLFNQEIRNAGSRAALFMAWPYERLNWVTLPEIAQAHRDISRELGVPVAPVGMAFERALAQRPALAMLGPDKEHESIHGTYLAANVIYATLYGENPSGCTYRPAGVSEEEAAFLQRIAWESVQAWKKASSGSATR